MTAPKNIKEPVRTPEELKARRQRTIDFLADQDAVDLMLERVAAGEMLRVICREHDITYSTTQVYIARHHTEAYEAAKRVRADSAIDDLETLEGKLESNEIDFNRFRELANSKKWRAEKLNPRSYGEHQTIDMTVVDKTRQHLDALRQMVRIERPAPRQQLPAPTREPILEAQFTDVSAAPERATEHAGPSAGLQRAETSVEEALPLEPEAPEVRGNWVAPELAGADSPWSDSHPASVREDASR